MNVFIMITCKRPLMGAFCVSSFTKLPTSLQPSDKNVMFHICAAVSTHPSIQVLNDLVTLSISNKQHLTQLCEEKKKKGKAVLIWKQKPKPQTQSHQEKQIFIVQVNFRLCNFAELLNTTIKHTVVFLSLEKYQ